MEEKNVRNPNEFNLHKKGARREPKGTKREQNGSQSEPKGDQREPQGNPKEPKGSQTGATMEPTRIKKER